MLVWSGKLVNFVIYREAKMQSIKRVLPKFKTLITYQRCFSNRTTTPVTKESFKNECDANSKQTNGLEDFKNLVTYIDTNIKPGEESQPNVGKSLHLFKPAPIRSITQEIFDEIEEETARATRSMTVTENKNNQTQRNVVPKRINEDCESFDLTELNEELPHDVTENWRSKPKKVEVPLVPSFNLAAYVNHSETLKQFLKMGVDLSYWDGVGTEILEFILRADFENDLKPYIQFIHDQGVHPEEFGHYFTKNPFIFQQDLNNLQLRIKNLKSKGFQDAGITRIIVTAPLLLNKESTEVDKRIAYLKSEFQLVWEELKSIVLRQPKLLTWPFAKIERVQFSMREEFGFTLHEMKLMILKKPKLWLKSRVALQGRFDFIHNKVGISHEQLSLFPEVLLCRQFRTKQRHLFLKSIKRDQYDPKKENYVSMKALVSGNDEEFCSSVAKTPVSVFNHFLKTL